MGIGIAIVAAAVIGGYATYKGGQKAAQAQTAAAQSAEDIQLEMYYTAREDQAPWREAGAEAVNVLREKLAAGPGEFKESEAYRFALEEGQKAGVNALSAIGKRRSGQRVKGAIEYAENMASREQDNFLRRWRERLAPLQSMAGFQPTGQMEMQTGANVAQAQLYGGNALAGGYINAANTISGMASGGLNTYLQYNALKNLRKAA